MPKTKIKKSFDEQVSTQERRQSLLDFAGVVAKNGFTVIDEFHYPTYSVLNIETKKPQTNDKK